MDKDSDVGMDLDISPIQVQPPTLPPQQQLDRQRNPQIRSIPTAQPPLQPRPQPKSEQQKPEIPPSQPPPPISQPPPSIPAILHPHSIQAFDHRLPMNVTPAPLNLSHVDFRQSIAQPQPSTTTLPTSNPVSHPDRLHLDHSRHDNQRLGTLPSIAHTRDVHPHTNVTNPYARLPGVPIRSPYTANQMHHVPHPHAHARHHSSYVNNTERLYPDQSKFNS